MASAFSHAIAAVALGKTSFIQKTDWKFWCAGIFCAVIPDADAIGFFMGVPYDSIFGHRGFTHSIFFAVLLSVFLSFLFFKTIGLFSKKWWAVVAFLFVATLSHPVLDAMTTGGLGVAFFAPFDNHRYFFPWRVIQVSPIGVTQFFSEWGWRVIKSELVWVWLPSLVIITMIQIIKKALVKKSKFEH